MTGADDVLAAHRDSAQARVHVLVAEIAALRAHRAAESADDEHDPEGVTLSAEWSRLEGLHADAVRELAAADEALIRRAGAGYGICVDCGVEIPSERLAARPTATRCVACQTRADG